MQTAYDKATRHIVKTYSNYDHGFHNLIFGVIDGVSNWEKITAALIERSERPDIAAKIQNATEKQIYASVKLFLLSECLALAKS